MGRIAIVCRDLAGLGGTTRTVIEHSRLLREQGWDVDVLAYRFDRARLEAAGANVRRVPGWPWGSWGKRRFFAWLSDKMASGADLVHGHGDNLEQDVLSLHNCVHAAHEAVRGKPLPESDSVGRLHARQLTEQRFKVLICNSRLMADDVRARYGVPDEKLRVIYPGHDPAKFNAADRPKLRAAARAELGYKESDVVIGLITSGDFEKRGVGLFLRALAELERKGLPFQALIAGKESRLRPYLEQAAQLGVGDRVRFAAARADVERFYHALDVYCHPALYEEFGQSVQEALACGLPVVCGKKVGAAELLAPGLDDYLCDPDSYSLAAKLEPLVRDAELRRRLGEAAPAGVKRSTWRNNFDATSAVYAFCLSTEKDKIRA